jgi:hypothetical protein
VNESAIVHGDNEVPIDLEGTEATKQSYQLRWFKHVLKMASKKLYKNI